MAGTYQFKPGPLFTSRTDVLTKDLVKPGSREIRVKTFPVALTFDRHLGSAAEMPVKFQGDAIIYNNQSRGYKTLSEFGSNTQYLQVWGVCFS